jgi:hypothetical protein
MDKGKKTKQRGGRTAADNVREAARKASPLGSSWALRLPRSLLKKGGDAKTVKKRGGRTAADSKGKGHAASYQKSFKKRQAVRARALTKKKGGGRAPATTGVKLNMGAPKVKTITARGMGAALRGGQFRENT